MWKTARQDREPHVGRGTRAAGRAPQCRRHRRRPRKEEVTENLNINHPLSD